ncbi:diaminobutyrate acetyltransferase [Paenibacillus soyae]|uniref:L-2,4-diaminobutyric acid acetyltransferase n=1 Tax=Paenibacillus soyae TaxID=2969249 RepID=A0A9X2MM62_9BACL|nr:diaminobutyrate acetyltransferase [Paenibacillus soyae]MCR2802810.1 diaminobutyrate acetyltransferase [Paenibacillus soyae]
MIDKNEAQLSCRKPDASDGQSVWKLVKRSGGLDVNSAYSYIMLCDMFRDTCCVVKEDERTLGFVSAFRKPSEPQTLFVWQIAVDPILRGNGIGSKLLNELLSREENQDIRYVEATVGPDNIASRQLFIRLAKTLGAECGISEQYGTDLFPESHEAELLLRIGPIQLPAGRRPRRD